MVIEQARQVGLLWPSLQVVMPRSYPHYRSTRRLSPLRHYSILERVPLIADDVLISVLSYSTVRHMHIHMNRDGVTHNANEMRTFPAHDIATPINDDVDTLARAPNILLEDGVLERE